MEPDMVTFNSQNLDIVLQKDNRLKPEEILRIALNDNDNFTPSKTTIWEKIGFKDKKKEGDLLREAIDGLQEISKMYDEVSREHDNYSFEAKSFTEKDKH
jgi:hypothetical protein